METARLNELVKVLSQEYQKNRSWAPVLDDLDHWLQLLGGAGASSRGFRPRPAPLGCRRRLASRRGPLPGLHPCPPPDPPPDHHAMRPRLSLFDAEKRPLSGTEPASPDRDQLKPILVDGQVVGWLGMRRHERPTNPLDVEFLRLQSQMFSAIGGVALLLAILVTIVLSRHLLAPVKELAEATRALTSRRFDTRIVVRSRDEFGQLAADFNNMAQALERYEQMRQQWMADISHELRTPLAILQGEIEAMQDGVREITPEGLESLHFEVLHVSRIVHDLHDLSLIESQAFQAELAVVNPPGGLG